MTGNKKTPVGGYKLLIVSFCDVEGIVSGNFEKLALSQL